MKDKEWDDYVTRNPMSFYGQMAEKLDEQRRETERQTEKANREYWMNLNSKQKTTPASPDPVPPNDAFIGTNNKPQESTSWSIQEVVGTIICVLFIWGGIATSENWLVGAVMGFVIGIIVTVLLFFFLKLLGWLVRMSLVILGIYIGYLILSALF